MPPPMPGTLRNFSPCVFQSVSKRSPYNGGLLTCREQFRRLAELPHLSQPRCGSRSEITGKPLQTISGTLGTFPPHLPHTPCCCYQRVTGRWGSPGSTGHLARHTSSSPSLCLSRSICRGLATVRLIGTYADRGESLPTKQAPASLSGSGKSGRLLAIHFAVFPWFSRQKSLGLPEEIPHGTEVALTLCDSMDLEASAYGQVRGCG
jgi:hypothetical protein